MKTLALITCRRSPERSPLPSSTPRFFLLAALISLFLLAAAAPATADTFTSAGGVTINDAPNSATAGSGNPYPSTISVTGLSGNVTKVTVTLHGVYHTFPDDMEVLLLGPNGQNIMLLSDALGSTDLNNLTFTFDDTAATPLPDSTTTAPPSGSYKPSNYTPTNDVLAAPAPAVSAHTTLAAAFNGATPNGDWKLFVADDLSVDMGYIKNGWSLAVTTTSDPATTFTSGTLISGGDGGRGRATPYGSPITVSGMAESLTTLKVTLTGLSHTVPDDLDILLMAPNGASMILLSDAGGGTGVVNINLTFDDAAAGNTPDAGPMVSATVKPTNYGRDDTMPDLPYPVINSTPAGDATFANVFNGMNPNGTWRLFIIDDVNGNSGSLASWTLDVTASAAPAGTVPAPGQLLITEYRQRGSNDQADEFIEIYNTSTAAITVQASDNSGGLGVASGDGQLRGLIPNGTVIPGHGHYLITSAIYPNATNSVNTYPGGNNGVTATTATRNAVYSGEIPDNQGVALFTSATAFNATTLLDAVGPQAEPDSLFREGSGLPTLLDYPPAGNVALMSLVRRHDLTTGLPVDTGDNAADFVFVETGASATTVGQMLGAPGPQNLTAPIYLGNELTVSAVDPALPGLGESGTAAGQVRSYSSVTNGTQGTLSIRRKFTNNSAAPLTRLRFRIIDVATTPGDPYSADMRALSSPGGNLPLTGGGTATVSGLTLESPPSQGFGGGLNSSLSASSVTLANPLLPGASIDVEFLFGIERRGAYDFTVIAETLPASGALFRFSTRMEVTNTNDSGPGSLRQACTDVYSLADAGSIVFSRSTVGGAVNFYDGASRTITFNNGTFILGFFTIGSTQYDLNIAIQGPGADKLTFSGGGTTRMFDISTTGQGNTIIDGVTLANGADGAIRSLGNLTVSRCTLANNTTPADLSGGAISSSSLLTVSDSTFSGNTFTGTTGAGAIYATGLTILNQCTLSGNSNTGDGTANAGAVLIRNSTLDVRQCTIVKNIHPDASGNGGVVTAAIGPANTTLLLQSSIVAGNETEFGDRSDLGFTTQGPGQVFMTSNGRNIAGVPASGNPPASNLTGTDKVLSTTFTPLYEAINLNLAFSGGHTKTHAIASGGPALNAGGMSTTLASSINAYINNLTLADGSLFLASAHPLLQLDNEQMLVTGRSGNILTVRRGVNGTTPALHFTGVTAFNPGDQRGFVQVGQRDIGAYEGLGTNPANPFFVTSASDSGPGSLRQAIALAATHPGPDTITFDPFLSGVNILLNDTLEINDPDPVIIDADELEYSPVISGPGDADFRLLVVFTGSSLTLRKMIFRDGGGDSFNASGAICYNEGTLRLENCTLSDSKAAGGAGGAIQNVEGSLTLINCTLANNSAQTGGAINNLGELNLIHCTIADNDATVRGGGVATDVTSGQLVTLSNTIIAGNFAPAANDLSHGEGDVILKGVNLVRVYAKIAGPVGTLTGPPLLESGADLNSLDYYGGPTPTMPPMAGSPAIDQAGPIFSPPLVDQRGLPRPRGVRPDIGAAEGPLLVVTTPVDELDPVGTPGAGYSLREAVRDVEPFGTILFDRAVFNGSTPATNVIPLTLGPLNPQREFTLDGTANPGGITVRMQFQFTQQPQALSLSAGETATFNVAVTAISGGVGYQWSKGAGGIPFADGPSYSISNVQESDEEVYSVQVIDNSNLLQLIFTNVNYESGDVRSQPASLIVGGTSLKILTQPAATTWAFSDKPLTLSVFAVGPASPAITYQWMKNGAKVPGATKSSLTFAVPQLGNAGTYSCVIKSGLATIVSDNAIVSVADRRVKVLHLAAGAKLTATALAAGNALNYNWRKNGFYIGFTGNPYIKNSVGIGDAGYYTCDLTSTAGTAFNVGVVQLSVSSAVPTVDPLALALPAATIGENYFYQFKDDGTAGAPATGWVLTGALPSGMKFDKTTGVLSGRPTTSKAQGYNLKIRGTNPKGPGPILDVVLFVNIVPAKAVGIFAGPLDRSPLNSNLGGRFDLTTTATGTFSGSITLGSRAKIPFKNQLILRSGSGDVVLYGKIPGVTLADKSPVTAYVEVFALEQVARLTLMDKFGNTLLGTAWRNPWLLSKNLALNNPATRYAAYYTARLDPTNTGTSPRGFGYLNFTVKPAGTLSLAGKLPDGSAITGGTHVGNDGQILLFNLLYSNRGSHVGQYTIIARTPIADNSLEGGPSWFKPAPLANSKDTVYKDGFGPLVVAAAGSPYTPPAKGSRVMGLPNSSPNASVGFSLGGLNTEGLEFFQQVGVASPGPTSTANIATSTPPLLNKTRITVITPATGLFSGSFTIVGSPPAKDRLAPFFGQIVTIGGNDFGYGYFLLPKVPVGTETVTTSPKLSGRVLFSELP